MTLETIRPFSFARWTRRAAAAFIVGASASVSAAHATDCPNPNANASGISLDAAQLAASTRDFAARYIAGDVNMGSCPDPSFVGYFNQNPSLNLTLTNTRAGGNLVLNLRTNEGDDRCDPVVLVYAPNGEWYMNDDGGSSIGSHWDALIDVPTPSDGIYRVWLGHYREGETCEGTLRVGYEQGAGGSPTGGPAPYAAWGSTSFQSQFSGQPGGVFPLNVTPGPHFNAGVHDIYIADAGNNGLGPYTGVLRYTVTLASNTLYTVDLGPTNTLRISENRALTMHYGEPGEGRASIYTNNTNPSRWRAICVLPTGTPYAQCGGDGTAIYSTWSAVTNDQRQFSTQPAGVFPISTCDRQTQQGGGDFPMGTYDIYVGNAGSYGSIPPSDIRRFTVTLQSGVRYAVDLGPPNGNGFSISANRPSMNMYSEPAEGYARIYHRNSNITVWRAMCVLPTGWDMSWCDVTMPNPCAGPSIHP